MNRMKTLALAAGKRPASLRATNRRLWAAMVLLVASAAACGEARAIVWLPDDRDAINFGDTTRPWQRAIGFLQTPDGWCSATKIDRGHVLTARHCFSEATTPNQVLFFPAYRGPIAPPATAASVSFSAIIHGTGFDGANGLDPYIGGSEFTVLTLDPSTYLAGNSGVPNIDDYPSIEPVDLPVPFPSTLPVPFPSRRVTVSAYGYSNDFNSGSLGAVHFNCSLRQELKKERGVVLSDCDRNKGASGGPLIRMVSEIPRVAAHLGGGFEGTTMDAWSTSNANREVSAGAMLWAPFNPTTLATASDGRVHVFADDADFGGQVMYRRQKTLSTTFHAWKDFRSSGVPSPNRLSATLLPDGRLWVFMAAADGTVWNRWQTAPSGNWSAWVQFFPGEAEPTGISDVAVVSAGKVTVQVYVMRENGQIFTTKKLGAWDGPWEPWVLVDALQNVRSIAVAKTGGFQQLFVATDANEILTTWTVDRFASDYAGWFPFADGLPTGQSFHIRAGYTANGSMDVFATRLATGATTRVLWRRTKTSPTPASAWGAWNFLGPPTMNALRGFAVGNESATDALDHVYVISSQNIFRSVVVAGVRGWRRFYGAAIP